MQGLAQRIARQQVAAQTLRLAPAPQGAYQRLTVLGAVGELRLAFERALAEGLLMAVEQRDQGERLAGGRGLGVLGVLKITPG